MKLNLKMMGFRISTQRRKMKITQEELAEKVEVSVKHISAIETGRTKANIELLYDIATCLGVTIDYFTLGVVKKNKFDEIEEYLRECNEDEIQTIKIIVKAFAENHNQN
jgi:transcriptional regulator with XRE-family HTH domain